MLTNFAYLIYVSTVIITLYYLNNIIWIIWIIIIPPEIIPRKMLDFASDGQVARYTKLFEIRNFWVQGASPYVSLRMLSLLQEGADWLNRYMARWWYVDFHGQYRAERMFQVANNSLIYLKKSLTRVNSGVFRWFWLFPASLASFTDSLPNQCR